MMQPLTLREFGVYKLPDGREFVVGRREGHGYSLFTPVAWRGNGRAEYYVQEEDGRLLSKGTPTRWRVQDLIDTGANAH